MLDFYHNEAVGRDVGFKVFWIAGIMYKGSAPFPLSINVFPVNTVRNKVDLTRVSTENLTSQS